MRQTQELLGADRVTEFRLQHLYLVVPEHGTVINVQIPNGRTLRQFGQIV